jgi:TetR/AcrR family transcriptional regulator, tetracycline repressor protein
MPMQKSQIVQSALAILDREGLEGVTLRRLATELNVKAASIYWHIPNKISLLDEMANTILEKRFGAFDFTNDQRDWEEWLDTLAHELRAAMLAHREGARVVAGAHPDIAFMLIKIWDLSIRVLHKHGFSYSKAATITMTVINFTFGSVIEEQTSPPIDSRGGDRAGALESFLDTFETMKKVMEEWQKESYDIHFDTSIRIIINGVRAELDLQP